MREEPTRQDDESLLEAMRLSDSGVGNREISRVLSVPYSTIRKRINAVRAEMGR